jgi:hypothetical protein
MGWNFKLAPGEQILETDLLSRGTNTGQEMKTALILPFAPREKGTRQAPRNQNGTVSHEAVRIQLSRILNSDGFARARRMRRFLTFIVEETLAGRSCHLCEYNIAVTVFDRSESFEAGIDPIVRNDARRLRQKLLEYYQRSQSGDEVLIEMPKGSYLPVFHSLSHIRTSRPTAPEYRLVISLIRVADGAEIWSARHDYTD